MKTLHMFKTILLICALVVGSGTTWATEKTETWSFGKSAVTNWTCTNQSNYCGCYYSGKNNACVVQNKSILNFSSVDFSAVTSPSVKIYVTGITNNGTNSYTVSLVDKDGNTIGTSQTKSNGLANSSNSGSATESYVTLTPVKGATGYRISLQAKGALTGTRYVLTYTEDSRTDIATLGNSLNVSSLNTGNSGKFSTTITPADPGMTEDTDYIVTWSCSPAEGLLTGDDGSYSATARGAYTVTATVTPDDDATYREVSKDYTVTVTEKVEVLADDVVMALGDDPKAITVVTTDGYAGTLSYESANTSVATVDASGNVTAVAKGTTKITISSGADASHYFTAGDDVEIDVTVKGQAGLAYAVTSYKVAYGASFPTPSLTNPHDLTVTYSKTGDNVATVNETTGAVTILSGTKGTARITASFAGNEDYTPGSAYYDIKVYDPDGGDGSLSKPFSVEEANEWIAENLSSEETSAENYYVRGVVSSLAANGKDISNGKQYFFISDDGTETDEIGVYYAKYLSNAAFSLTTWVMPGDEVVVYGPLQNYDGAQPYYVETSDNTYLQSITRKSFDDSTLPVNETFNSSFGSFTTDGTTVRKDNSSTTFSVWTLDGTNHYAKATSYVTSTNVDAESMLISGMIDGRKAKDLELSFSQCVNKYFGKAGTSITNNNIANEAMVYAREVGGEWIKQTVSGYPVVSGSWSSFDPATVDLSAFDGKKFQVAFVYKGTTTTAGTWEIKNVKVTYDSETITIPESKYLSFCSGSKLDFSSSDVKAYKAKVEDNKVTLSKLNVVPAEEGVVLYCEIPGSYDISVTDNDASDVTGNEMVGVLGRTQVLWNPSLGVYNYILQQGQFNKATDGYLKANRAYLSTSYNVTAPGARSLEIIFDDNETTGIKQVEGSGLKVEGYYNLNGQKVQNPTKGLYIVNGKKVIIK